MSDSNADKLPRRFSVTLCHEAGHYILLEQKRRKDLGLPHTALNDVVNDWLLGMGQECGFPAPSRVIRRYASADFQMTSFAPPNNGDTQPKD